MRWITNDTMVREYFQSFVKLVQIDHSPTVSPQSAMIVGPGKDPLMSWTGTSTPSGEAVVFSMLNQYSRVIPVSGTCE